MVRRTDYPLFAAVAFLPAVAALAPPRIPATRARAQTCMIADPLGDPLLFGAGAVAGAAALWGAALTQRPPDLANIYVRPGASQHGVGLIAIRSVPTGTIICRCEAKRVRSVQRASLATLPRSVRRTIHELYDGFGTDGTCWVPSEYDQSIPLVSFINHDGDEPNCFFDEERHAIVNWRALRAGEEATVDYFDYQEPHSWTYRHAAAGFPSRDPVLL